MDASLLEVQNISCNREKNKPIFSDVSFFVNEGDIVVLQGKSGSGKTTLLKCLAHLNMYSGTILFRGKTPTSYGVPAYRTRVLYVPQRPALLPGTPHDFLRTVRAFRARGRAAPADAGTDADAAVTLASTWGVDATLWERPWAQLSGGEAQRVALAAAVGLGAAEVLLLDEPTSALDPEASQRVEAYLVDAVRRGAAGAPRAIVWITHSGEQALRVGTRFLRVADGGCAEEDAGAAV